MSDHFFAVIGIAFTYIALFGFGSFLVLWALNCWWRVYQVYKGIGPLVKFVNKNRKSIRKQNDQK